MDSIPAFKHEPLLRPSQQIRLLRIHPTDNGGGNIAADFTTWNLVDAPTYNTVSYTWGDTKTREISINGRPCCVRSNCYDALCQIRLRHANENVWIDAICINQDDLEEKACQLPLMCEIYKRAAWTLVCLGPHADESHILSGLVKRMVESASTSSGTVEDPIFANTAAIWPKGTMWWPLVSGREDEYITEICTALEAFSRRPYWQRLWVFQELATSEGYVKVLCGDDVLLWDELQMIFKLLEAGEVPEPIANQEGISLLRSLLDDINSLWCSHAKGILDTLLAWTAKRQCSDTRDHIYGILGLVDWEIGQVPVTPDYNKTAFDLAIEAIAHIRHIEVVPTLLEALGLHYAQADIQNLFKSGSNDSESTCKAPSSCHQSLLKELWSWTRTCATVLCAQDKSLMIAAARKAVPERTLDLDTIGPITNCCRPQGCGEDKYTTLRNRDHECVAMATPQTEAGDVVFPVTWSPFVSDHFLVLRHNGVAFDIVGQGFFLPGFEISIRANAADHPVTVRERKSVFFAKMVLTLSILDVMRLVGQDFIGTKTYDIEARLQRPVTHPIDRPEGAVRLRRKNRPTRLEDTEYGYSCGVEGEEDDNLWQAYELHPHTAVLGARID